MRAAGHQRRREAKEAWADLVRRLLAGRVDPAETEVIEEVAGLGKTVEDLDAAVLLREERNEQRLSTCAASSPPTKPPCDPSRVRSATC